MTPEEKAKAYDEAKARMSKAFNSNRCTIGFMNEIFPELAESEDERIRKAIIATIHLYYGEPLEDEAKDMIAWLEKLGYKPQGKTALEAANEEKVDNANKAEPKFHEDEWITDGVCTTQIDSVDDRFYWHDNNRIGGLIDKMNKAYHLWTIQDAKPGDVLACEDGWTCIFKSLNDGDTFGSYCFMDSTKWFCEKGSKCHTLNTEYMKAYHGEIKPATKEQRDLLFAKMKEAGYEWNAEKKELKKIEQKLASSAKPCKNDTLLDLLQKMPSCVTVDGIDYHFVMKKTIAYMAFYEGEGECSGKVIFWMAGEPIALLTAMLNKLKEEGLLESF